MGNHAQPKKRHRQDEKRRARNRIVRGQMRTAVKKAIAAGEAGKKEEAKKLAGAAVRLVDRAYGKGTIKRNTASRLVSSLSRHLKG